jgi:hypothetical protein
MCSKQFTRQVFSWLHQVNRDKRLLAIDLCVAVELTDYFNENDNGGRAWPSCKTLGNAIGLHEVTILRSVDRLEANGHLRIVRGRQGRGHPHQYWMVLKPATGQVLRSEKPANQSEIKPASQSRKPAGRQENHLTNHEGVSLRETPSHGEREDQPSADLFSHPGAAAPNGAAPEEDQNEELELSSAESSSRSLGEPNLPKKEGLPRAEQVEKSKPRTDSERDAGFEKERLAQSFAELRALWRRGHPADDTEKAIAVARAAYAKAIARGARPDEIFEIAKQWVAAADAPRFLPALPSWLATQGYLKPPPEKKRTREPARGNGAHRGGYRNGNHRRPSLAERMLALSETEA